MNNTAQQFKEFMHLKGIPMEGMPSADGTLHRFFVPGDKPRSLNGWYILYNDNMSCGVFGSWKEDWKAEPLIWRSGRTQNCSPSEKLEFAKWMEETKRQYKEEKARCYAKCRDESALIWEKAVTPVDHPYLKRKLVNAHDIRMMDNVLLIPVYDPNGCIRGFQKIFNDGTKRFKTDTQKQGGFHLIGGKPNGNLIVAEGYATAASIYEATSIVTAVAFDCGNLLPAAENLQQLFPDTRLIIAADYDHHTPGNPGLTKATKAAECLGAKLVIPIFPPGVTGTDFNDLAVHNIDLVREHFSKWMVHKAEAYPFDIHKWCSTQWFGEPDPVRWLVEGKIELGVPALLAGMGGIGKSFVLLSLALAIATGNGNASWCGNNVLESGTAVFITAEDSALAIHRRLHTLDKEGNRFRFPDKLLIIPLPDEGGAFPLVTAERGRFRLSDQFEGLMEQLMSISDLKLIAFDPLQAFTAADINKDPAAGQFFCSAVANLSAMTGATTIVSHHMRKPDKDPKTVSDVRNAIRGTSALVDGMRAALALWTPPEKDGMKICSGLNIQYNAQNIVNLAVVKANGEESFAITTMLRSKTGVLEVIETANMVIDHELAQQVTHQVRNAVLDDNPYTLGNHETGVWVRRVDFPFAVQQMSARKIVAYFEKLIENGWLIRETKVGSSRGKYLNSVEK